jgi:hypothetical protein
MTWQPKFQFLSIKPFRDNIVSAIMANQVGALAWAAAQSGISATLPPLADAYTARAVRDKYPVINALVLGSDPQATNSGDYDENKRLLLEVENIGSDGEQLIETLEPYVLMVRSVVSEMTEEDLTAGFDSSQREGILITVGSERYGERQYESENTYVQVGSVIATISYREVERG